MRWFGRVWYKGEHNKWVILLTVNMIHSGEIRVRGVVTLGIR